MTTENRAQAVPKRKRIFAEQTQGKIEALESRLKTPVVVYWTSTRGSVCQNDVTAMSRLLSRSKRQRKVSLFLKSSGGDPEAALRLVHLLRQHFDHITLLAPFACASAATMVALGANEIQMGPTSYLTAVDSSLTHDLSPVDHNNYLVSVSHDEVLRIIRLWKEQKAGGNPYPEVYKYLHPLVLGALDRSSSLSMRVCRELLGYHIKSRTKANRISRALNYDYPSHTYPVTAREARRLGLHILDLNPAVDSLLHELEDIYAEMSNPLIIDRDPMNYHAEEVYNVLEVVGRQIFYETNKDWFYRKEERRWIPMHDKSGWFSCTAQNGRWRAQQFFIR
jgi:hypothetical protein